MSEDLVAVVVALALRVQGALERAAAEHAVTAAQARLLEALRVGAPTINELSRSLGLDKSSTSGLVDRAQQRGLVRRVRSQLDRRSVRVRLTPHGQEILAAVSSAFASEVRAMLEPLGHDEQAALMRHLSTLPLSREPAAASELGDGG